MRDLLAIIKLIVINKKIKITNNKLKKLKTVYIKLIPKKILMILIFNLLKIWNKVNPKINKIFKQMMLLKVIDSLI